MLISKIKQQYPNKLINTFNVVPSSLSNGNALDCYNTVLTLKSLAEEANGCFFFDNESLRSTCKNVMNIQNVKLNDTNDLIGRYMVNYGACERSSKPTSKNADLKSISNVLNSQNPKLHFYVPNLSFNTTGGSNEAIQSFSKNESNSLLSVKTNEGRNIGFASILRSNESNEFDIGKLNAQIKWIPNNSTVLGISDKLENNSIVSLWSATNTTNMKLFFERILNQTEFLYSKRAYMSHYMTDQMEPSEFSEVIECLNRLMNEYGNESLKTTPIGSVNTSSTVSTTQQTLKPNNQSIFYLN